MTPRQPPPPRPACPPAAVRGRNATRPRPSGPDFPRAFVPFSGSITLLGLNSQCTAGQSGSRGVPAATAGPAGPPNSRRTNSASSGDAGNGHDRPHDCSRRTDLNTVGWSDRSGPRNPAHPDPTLTSNPTRLEPGAWLVRTSASAGLRSWKAAACAIRQPRRHAPGSGRFPLESALRFHWNGWHVSGGPRNCPGFRPNRHRSNMSPPSRRVAREFAVAGRACAPGGDAR